ncbi:MAG: glycosyltransferase family 2 protein [Mariprofundaceae bacterium]|nr:glycosyltransferase family 2 protein [Mariprofundaceae bacterium]
MTMQNKPIPVITVVIPAFNEADRIIHTLSQVKPFVDEIIVVDDASIDCTAKIAEEHGAKVFTQTANSGYIAAIKRGFKEVSGDIVITMDADGEFPAQAIPELIKPIIDGHADMVQGSRNIIPRPSERVLTWLAQRKAEVGDSGTGFRAIRTDLAKQLEIKGACICGVLALEVISKGGRIIEVPIELQPTNKPRKIAWFHFKQFYYLLPWIFRNKT